MSLLDGLADLLGYTKTQPITSPVAWQRAQATGAEWELPPLTMPEAQADLYKRLSWVQIAIGNVASVAATTKLSIKRLEGEDEVDIPNHPFEILLDRPNPLMSRYELLEALTGFRLLTGQAFLWLNRTSNAVAPSEMWVIPTSQIEPVPDENLYLRGYMYDAGNGTAPIPLDLHEIVHFKRWNPTNPFVGLSGIEALATVAIGDMSMQKWNTNFFSKDHAKPPGALAFADPIADSDWDRLKDDINRQHGGVQRRMMMLRNAGKGGVEWINMAVSQKDMEFLSSRTFNRSEIFGMLAPGLDSILAINATEANATAGKRTFIDFGVWPGLVSMAEKITNDILPSYGPNLRAEFDDIRVTDKAMELAEQSAFATVATIDEIRKRYYQLDPIGDERGVLLVAEITAGKANQPEPVQRPTSATIGQPMQVDGTPTNDAETPTETATAKAVKSATVKAHTSTIVAFCLGNEYTPELIRMQGYMPMNSSLTPSDEFHITLAYMGDASDMQDKQELLLQTIRDFSADNPSLYGNFGGLGRFNQDDGGVNAVYVQFDSPWIQSFRTKLIDRLVEVGLYDTPELDHGYTPHITLGYIPADSAMPSVVVPKYKVFQGTITVLMAGERVDFPLGDFGQTFNAGPVDVASKARTEDLARFRRWASKRRNPDPDAFKSDVLTYEDKAAVLYDLLIGEGGDADTMPPFTLTTGPLTRDGRKAADDFEDLFRLGVEEEFTEELAQAMTAQLNNAIPKGMTPETAHEAVGRLQADDQRVRDVLRRRLQQGADLGVSVAVDQFETIGLGIDWTLANQAAAEWVNRHAATVYNQIEGTTVRRMQTAIDQWITNGDSLPKLVKELRTSTVSKRRAKLIAQTETTRAYATANEIAYRESGVVNKIQWRAANDELVCPICGPLHHTDADLGGQFFNKDDGNYYGIPPAHPNCRCWIVPVIKDLPAIETPVAPPPAPPAILDDQGFPLDLAILQDVRGLGGSTGARLMQEPTTGNFYVMKKGSSPAHLLEETYADAAYKAMGVNVPDFKVYTVGEAPVKIAKFIKGETLETLKTTNPKLYKAASKKVQKDFAKDAVMGNWDVVGLNADNIMVDAAGDVWRIDNGGALRYRAQGTMKKEFTKYADELWTMRNPGTNPAAANMFGDLGFFDIEKQMRATAKYRGAVVDALPDSLKAVMGERIDLMADLAKVSGTLRKDSFVEKYVDDFARHSVGIRKAGLVDKMPKNMTLRGGVVYDDAGKPWDNLRGSSKDTLIGDLGRYMASQGGDYNTITYWSQRQSSDSWLGAPQATKYFYAKQRSVDLSEYWWKYGVDKAEGHYLGAIKAIGELKYSETMTSWHAFNYEFMRNANFKNNNLSRGFVKLIRTENYSVMSNAGIVRGESGIMARGAAESTSIFESVSIHGSEVTTQNVPHHRIFGNYMFERSPGYNATMFLNDRENELIAMLEGIEAFYGR